MVRWINGIDLFSSHAQTYIWLFGKRVHKNLWFIKDRKETDQSIKQWYAYSIPFIMFAYIYGGY